MDSSKLWQDRYLIVAWLGTMVDDKKDDNDLLDDKSPSASFDSHQKIQTAHSFFLSLYVADIFPLKQLQYSLPHDK